MEHINDHEPYSGEPDEFDLIAGELIAQIEDPYVSALHQKARYYEAELAEMHEQLVLADEDADNEYLKTRLSLRKELDDEWRYMGQQIVITGVARIGRRAGNITTDTDEVSSEEEPSNVLKCVGMSVLSGGFDFVEDRSDPSKPLRVGHFFTVMEDDVQLQCMILLDDLEQIELPTPSPEARVQNFAYYHPEEAAWLDDIAAMAQREDQVIADLREFYYDINFDFENSHDEFQDVGAYVESVCDIEPEASYSVTHAGNYIIMMEDGSGEVFSSTYPNVSTLKIHHVVMRPADPLQDELEGAVRCTPYIMATLFKSNGDDVPILIPCTDILSMHSLRYDGPTLS